MFVSLSTRAYTVEVSSMQSEQLFTSNILRTKVTIVAISPVVYSSNDSAGAEKANE